MRRFLFGLAAVILSVLAPAAAQAGGRERMLLAELTSPTLISEVQLLRLDHNLRQAMQTGDFVGLSVVVVRDGEIRFLRTYGEKELGSADPVDPDTLFRIASLSKGFASSMAGLAAAEGKLSLDAPVSGFAPELALPRGSEKRLKLSDILSHRTGLPPNAYDNLLEAGTPPEAILAEYRKVKPTCAVADCYAYQNVPFDLSAKALSQAYGLPFPELVQARLFAPLGMKTATYGLKGLTGSGNWARPHSRERQRDPALPAHPWRVIEVQAPYYSVPAAGGVNASIRDMAEWLKAQLGGAPEVLPQEVLDLIHAPRVSTPTETQRMRGAMPELRGSHYGYGWRVYDYAGRAVIAHGGSVDGYGAQIMFVPEARHGIVVLSNAGSRRMWAIAPMYLDLMLGLPPRDWFRLQPEAPATPVAK